MVKTSEFRVRDPFVLAENNKYYMYTSGCPFMRGYCDTFVVRESDDLINWSDEKVIFKADKDFWSHLDYWAPEVHKYNGKYYLFASFRAEGKCRASQIFVCDTPDGEFKPVSDGPVTPADWWCLDGTLYVSPDNKPYIVFCHEWVQIHDGTICYMELSEDLSKAVSEPVTMFKGSDPKWAKSVSSKERGIDVGYVTDGPYLYRTKTGTLLMIWSGFSEGGYTEGIAVSDNGDITGNWTNLDIPLFGQGGGHGMIFTDLEGELKFVMHTPNFDQQERAKFTALEDLGDTIKIKE